MLEKASETTKVTDCEGRLPLHLAACNSGIHINSIQDLIIYNERAIRTPDDFGLLPLHWACTKDAPANIVETIIKAFPYAVEKLDSYNRLPMDRIKASKNPEKARIIELLSREVTSWSSAMMSTIVELSSKMAAAEKKELEYKLKEGECKVLFDQNNRSFNEINLLTEEIFHLKEQFVDKLMTLKKNHAVDLRIQQENNSEDIVGLRKEKEEVEKKAEDLKILVDELVEKLRIHKSLVDLKEDGRKELKLKAHALVKRLEEAKRELEEKSEENEALKMNVVRLNYEIQKRDQHIQNLSGRSGHDGFDPYEGMGMDYRSRAPYDAGRDDDRNGGSIYDDEIPRTFECVRIKDDESY